MDFINDVSLAISRGNTTKGAKVFSEGLDCCDEDRMPIVWAQAR